MPSIARSSGHITRIPHILFGGDYNPEQWPEEVWLEDAGLMRAAGVNLVSLGIFAWTKLEPAPGRYDFAWLDRVLELLHAQGVAVDLATPSASPPAWLVRMHPEILPVTADGITLWHGSRRHYCPSSAAYREQARGLVQALAEHYRDHPVLALWHIDNEYACHVTECFCDASAAAFRDWLRDRYESLDALNAAWGTAFWSQTYGDWQEIQPPRRMPAIPNPTQQLDWQRFTSDAWLGCFRDQEAILRRVTPDIPITTNFMGFHKPLDYWTWAAREDVVSNDSYPDTSDAEWMIDAGMVCDLMRSLGNGRPWILMEQATGHVNWRPRNATKRPGVMRLGSYQALARGADAVLFFQWRASRAGAEKYHSAMLPHAGTDSRTWREVTGLGAELGGLDELVGSRVQADVGILFDWQSWWALELDGKPSSLRLMPQVRTHYAALFRRNVTVDFVHPGADLTRYRLLIAPLLYLVDDDAVRNISDWVGAGGTLLMSFFSGIVDRNEHIRLGGYPAPFRELLGLRVEEFAPYQEGTANAVRTVDGQTFAASTWSDVIRAEGADVLGRFTEDWFADSPAITEHAHGQGRAFYVGTALDEDGLGWILERACRSAGVQGVELPRGVEAVSRSDGERRWSILLNYSGDAAEVALDAPGVDLLTGRAVTGSISLGPTDVAIVRAPA